MGWCQVIEIQMRKDLRYWILNISKDFYNFELFFFVSMCVLIASLINNIYANFVSKRMVQKEAIDIGRLILQLKRMANI